MTEQSMAERIEAIKSLIRLYVHPANVREVMIENIDALAEQIARLEREQQTIIEVDCELIRQWRARAESAEAQIAVLREALEYVKDRSDLAGFSISRVNEVLSTPNDRASRILGVVEKARNVSRSGWPLNSYSNQDAKYWTVEWTALEELRDALTHLEKKDG